ncbi:hypothetical protein Tco_1274474 [Tanacetum coccineum]
MKPTDENEEDADNNEEDDDNEEDAENEENADNEEDADNNEEDDDNEEEADNEDQDDNEENKEMAKDITKTVEEKQHKKKRKMERSETEEPEKKKSNRQKSTYKGTMKKSGSKKNPIIEESPKRFTRGDAKRQAEFENVDKQNEAEDDEDVKSISSDDVIVETKKKGRKSKGKKEGKKMKKAEEETQVESEEDNDIEEGENNQSEEEEGDRKLTKDKMDKGLESESEGDEQLKKVTKPKKGKGSKAEKPYPTCNTRSSPKPMYEAMMTLTDPQKKCLKDMGFERMIHFPIVELPSALAYHAIDHFHPGSMELRLEKGSIKATRQKVHDMLGIPMGSRKLEDLEERPSNDPFIKEWEKQFKHVPKPTPAAIASVISDTTEADFMFRMNFITLFGSTMGTLDNGGRVSTKLLKRIIKDIDISDIDSELVRTLRNGVKKFENDNMMIDFCKQYGELFNDHEDVVGDNDKNNNNDDDGAPTVDANKKKERTEENGSEATEGGSDGKEENMNEDKREVTAQMDVDNQNKELNKEKDANETEDNDKMNNIDMKNDSVKEKQDTDKDENAKVDNIVEKHGDHKDEIGEDEFWNTQFTDSYDFIFEMKEGNATIQDYMQILAPTLKIKSNVIETYCLVLNHEQGVISKRKKTKHFFYTRMIKYDEVKQYKSFSDIMKKEFKKDDEVKKLKDLEMTKDMFNWKMEDGKKYDEVKQYKNPFLTPMKNEFKQDGMTSKDARSRKGSTVGKKPVKDKKTKQKKTVSPSTGRTLKINEMLRKTNAKIEAKRIADEEEAAKDKEEEEETEETVDDENVEKEVEKNVVELANEAATKSVEELFAILENDVDNMEKDVEDEEAKSADEEANLVEEQESEQADNEEDSEENDDINQIFNNIQTMPFLNTATRSNKNQVGKGLTKTVVDEAKKKKREEQIEKKRKLEEQKKKEKQDKDSNQKKFDEKEPKVNNKRKLEEKVNMEESAEEESEVEKHDDDIGIETESEDEEEMVKKTKKGKNA